MSPATSTAIASPNIAFIKYWGDRDHDLRIPANPSLSMTLDGLQTETSLTLLEPGAEDVLILNGARVSGPPLARVSGFLAHVRAVAGRSEGAKVDSVNSYPAGAGIASSAAAFAALALAASSAYSLDASPTELSRFARRGSGSAARSIFSGFVEMQTGQHDEDAYAKPFLPPDHWPLQDWVAVVDDQPKPIGSSEGHLLAKTSPIQLTRVNDAGRRMQVCRHALIERDFNQLAAIIEQDSNLMHAVMITSTPSLLYLQPASLMLMRSIKTWRAEGIEACFTIDAGPNVHVICTPEHSREVERRLRSFEVVKDLIHATPGQGAKLQKTVAT